MWQRRAGVVFSDWTDRFVAILVRKVSGLHIKKRRNGLEMGEQVGGNWWGDLLMILFRCSI